MLQGPAPGCPSLEILEALGIVDLHALGGGAAAGPEAPHPGCHVRHPNISRNTDREISTSCIPWARNSAAHH
eukprot:5643000-Karenia_brevis.AAC.1